MGPVCDHLLLFSQANFEKQAIGKKYCIVNILVPERRLKVIKLFSVTICMK